MANPNKKKYEVGQLFPCNACGEIVLATDSIVRNSNYRCKKCRNKFIEKYQKNNPNKVKEWRANYLSTDAGKQMIRASVTRYRKDNKEKAFAHWTVQHAKRSGKLRQQLCEECGESNTHAHHDDYSKPLTVRWLCPKCHKKHHQQLLKALEQ